jgi:hypothetical protein
VFRAYVSTCVQQGVVHTWDQRSSSFPHIYTCTHRVRYKVSKLATRSGSEFHFGRHSNMISAVRHRIRHFQLVGVRSFVIIIRGHDE